MSRIRGVFAGLLFVFCVTFSASGAILTVTKIAYTNDGTCDGDCSLREAIGAANLTVDNDTIEFSAVFDIPQTITMTSTDLIITNNRALAINGPGANKLAVSGNNRVFTNNTGSVASISELRVTGGTGTSTVTTGRGGGVFYNTATRTLNRLVISRNAMPTIVSLTATNSNLPKSEKLRTDNKLGTHFVAPTAKHSR